MRRSDARYKNRSISWLTCIPFQLWYFALTPVYKVSTIMNPSSSLIRIFKPLPIFCGCTVRFVSDLVGNPEDRFYHIAAHNKLTSAFRRNISLSLVTKSPNPYAGIIPSSSNGSNVSPRILMT